MATLDNTSLKLLPNRSFIAQHGFSSGLGCTQSAACVEGALERRIRTLTGICSPHRSGICSLEYSSLMLYCSSLEPLHQNVLRFLGFLGMGGSVGWAVSGT